MKGQRGPAGMRGDRLRIAEVRGCGSSVAVGCRLVATGQGDARENGERHHDFAAAADHVRGTEGFLGSRSRMCESTLLEIRRGREGEGA